jgi:putative protease
MEVRIGKITHYYNKIAVAVMVTSGEMKIGDYLHIRGHTTDFYQPVTSMEIEHQQVSSVGPASEVALKVKEEVRRGDRVYKVTED